MIFGEKAHPVEITKSFSMQATHVTQLQWFLLMGHNPSNFDKKEHCPDSYVEINGISLCSNNPVERVSWSDIQDFILKLNSTSKDFEYRLPTEAEWELAVRADTQTAYSFGDFSSELDKHAWFSENSGSRTHEVAEKKSNGNGLYDMHGNLWQWTQDLYEANYNLAGDQFNTAVKDPVSSAGSSRVIRGGSCYNGAGNLRSACRRLTRLGLRWCRLPGTRQSVYILVRARRL